MGVIGNFGDIVFETSSAKILTPQGLTRDTTSRWTSHDVVARKPVSEFVGPGLDTVHFSIVLNNRFGLKPKEVMDKFLDYCRSGQAFPLIIGTAIGVDKWKLTSVSQAWGIIGADGVVTNGTVDLVFEEYITTTWGES